MSRPIYTLLRILIGITLLLGATHSAAPPRPAALAPGTYIVQAGSAAQATAAVTTAGGAVTQPLEIIGGVAATLDPTALARLQQQPGVTLHADRPVRVADHDERETRTRGYLLYPAVATGAFELHHQRVPTQRSQVSRGQVVTTQDTTRRDLQGWGVTVAVIDSGLINMANRNQWDTQYPDGTLMTVEDDTIDRFIVYRDFLPRDVNNANNGSLAENSIDQNGHGTHVVATIADYHEEDIGRDWGDSHVGVAPQVNLVVARALDRDGAGSYAQVIAALDWIVANKARYNIRVLNLSLYAPVGGPYWADPLNQAVMRAWQAGIVVVTAAGNSGPTAGTITAPGNIPYVITAGAIKSGRYTASGYDELAYYSGRGPTESAFVKPDVLVPASRTIAPMPTMSVLGFQMPEARIQRRADMDFEIIRPFPRTAYYQLSGTSMAAAQVSGIVALMLQAHPALTPDQVKYRLLATARQATDPATSAPVYSVWEQGAGLINTRDAVFTNLDQPANAGLDINLDLTSTTHYWGYTTWDPADGLFKLTNPATGQSWAGAGQSWAGAGQSWAGAGQSWAGTGQSWAGAGQSWAGTGQSWAGVERTWAGSQALWAGSGQSWAGAVPPPSMSTASHTDVLTDEP